MIRKIIEAPFKLAGWLVKDTYGRVVSVLIIMLLACMVNYPIQDVEVGVWQVEDVLKEEYSKKKATVDGKEPERSPDVDRTGRVDRTARMKRKTLSRVELRQPWALLTLPFHNVAERELKVLDRRRDEKEKHLIIKREVLLISRGLTLGLDLQGGTELTYKIDVPEGSRQSVNAQEIAEVIRVRIDAHGLREPRVQPIGEDRILVQIPGFDKSDVAEVRSSITEIGRLEFRIVADEQHDKNTLEEARRQEDPPQGWHWYELDRTEKGEEAERLLISDEIGLTGEQVETVGIGRDKTGTKWAIHLTFTDRQAFWRLTRANVKRRLAIIFNDVRDKDAKLVRQGTVHSAPTINEPIHGGAEISGDFTSKELKQLRLVLQSGSLKAPLALEREQFVGPYQGLQSIEDGKRAIAIGFVLVVVFILIYYLKAGLVADFALLLNLLILVAALALKNTTLTLPGIAGIILTVGMSIDANVLIFERIREELKKTADKPLLKCMRDGHRKALVTIIDANLTTFLTALILHMVGTGPVKGFAITLSYGIVISMFTAVVVTRIVLEALNKAGLVKSLQMLEVVKHPRVPFVGMRRVTLTVSTVCVVAGLVFFFSGLGDRFGIEFRAGTKVQVSLRRKVTADVVRELMSKAGYKDIEVQDVASVADLKRGTQSDTFDIRLSYVPTVLVKSSGRITDADPNVDGGAEVVIEASQQASPEEMKARLARRGSPKCSVVPGPKVGEVFTYTIRSLDKSENAVSKLQSNVKEVFENELITDDIRRAFTDAEGQSLLVDEGVRELPDPPAGKLKAQVTLKSPMTPSGLQQAFADSDLKDTEVTAAGKLDGTGVANAFVVTAAPDALPKIKDILKRKNIATPEPFPSVEKVSPSVATEMGVKAGAALALALIAIIAYIWFRFEFRFGLAAVVALVHDVSITLALLALTGREISLTVIAALLTIIGYSLNDTIVVFDRIRENRRTVRKTTFPDIVNLSINQTLSRTLLTSVTTLLAVLSLFIWGGTAIEDFAFTLLVGVVVGTYSSIFIASPILLMTGEQGALRGPLGVPSARIARPLEGVR